MLGERLRRMQVVALGFGAAAVGVLTVAYGRVPWIALVLACSFGGYSFLKKAVPVGAVTSLAVETLVLLPVAAVGLVALAAAASAAFLHGSVGRDALLVSLGVVTAVPLLLFGTAARRIPLTLLGLLQYLTPTLQLICGVVGLPRAAAPGPAGRLRARVGGAGGAGRRRRRASAGAPSPSRWPSRRERRVNILGHTHVALAGGRDDAGYLLGAVLPDLAPMAGVKVARDALGPPRGRRRALPRAHRRGVPRVTPPSWPGSRALRRALDARGVASGPARAVGHAGWELLLDGTLVGGPTEAAFRRAMAAGGRRRRWRCPRRTPAAGPRSWTGAARRRRWPTTTRAGSPTGCTACWPGARACACPTTRWRPSPRCWPSCPPRSGTVAPDVFADTVRAVHGT